MCEAGSYTGDRHSVPFAEDFEHGSKSLEFFVNSLQNDADIAREFQLPLPGYSVADIRPLVQIVEDDRPDASTYLAKFGVLREFYRSPQIIDRIAYEAVADAAAENIVYFELRFTPHALARIQGYPLAEVTDWVIDATRRAAADFGVDVAALDADGRRSVFDRLHNLIFHGPAVRLGDPVLQLTAFLPILVPQSEPAVVARRPDGVDAQFGRFVEQAHDPFVREPLAHFFTGSLGVAVREAKERIAAQEHARDA